jgi:CDP-paratose synthetase
MKKVLLTGGTGFLGEALLPLLSEFEVDLLVRDSAKTKDLPNYNILTLADLKSAKKYDAVVHLAAFISSGRDPETAEKLVKSNIGFPTEALSKIKIRENGLFIDTGTFAEKWFGNKYGVSYLYAETKKAFERIASFYCKVNRVNYARVIPYTIYSEVRQKGKILDLLLNSIDSDDAIPISEGQQVLDFIHRNDVARIYKLILKSEDYRVLDQRSFDCCTGIGRSIRSVAKLVEETSGHKCNLDWGKVSYREQDIMYAVGDPGDAFNILRWKPIFTLEDTIRASLGKD